MSKKKKMKKDELKDKENIEETINEEVENKQVNEDIEKETSLEEVEPELEETESYKQASFGEKLSLRFRKRLITSKIHTLTLVLFLIAVIWGINAWSDTKNLAQIDVTQNQLYSLTNVSKDQLKNLKKEVKIYVYGFTKQEDIVQFLAQYNALNKNIKYELISESTNYELVTKYNLGSMRALVVACDDRDRTIYPDYEFSTMDYNTGDTINLAEEVITNAILKVSTDDPVKVYFATGNNEYSKDELYILSNSLEDEVYEIEDLNLLTVTEIPSDCDILAILSPEEDLTETQAELIKNYANNGGNLLICAYNSSDVNFTNLQSVLDLYGVTINEGLLIEGDSKHYLAYQNSIPLQYVLIPGYSSANPITSKFSDNSQMVIMPWSQSLTINDVEEEGVTVTSSEIVTSSSKCYNVTDYSRGISNEVLKELDSSLYTIGSELTRTVKNGDSTTESKLVIYANTTFFTDTYRNSTVQIATMSQPGNFNLVMNTFAELAEEDDLLTIRKASNVTEFQTTESDVRTVKLIIFGIPVVIIVLGIIIWNHRRNKR